MRRLVIGVACLALAGCSGAPERQARLVLEHGTSRAPIYIEGFLQYVELRGDDSEFRRRFEEDRLELTVPVGDYTLVSYTRALLGHCGDSLDLPRSFCDRHITVGNGTTTAYTVRTKVEKRCSIRTR